jgi:hypothetical protein
LTVKPDKILSDAAAMINKRASDRDLKEERTMASVVAAFNALFGTNLTETMGWQFMEILKIKRGSVGPYKEDDFLDGAAYVALAAEARAKEWAEISKPVAPRQTPSGISGVTAGPTFGPATRSYENQS